MFNTMMQQPEEPPIDAACTFMLKLFEPRNEML